MEWKLKKRGKMLKNKAQSSLETMILTSFFLLLIFLFFGIAMSTFNSLQEQIEKQRGLYFVNELYENAKSVFIQGKNASKTVILYFPYDANITSNQQTVILTIRNSTIARDFGFNISIVSPNRNGYVLFIINNSGNFVGVYPQ